MPMPPRKTPAKKGLLPKLKSFLDALGDRYQKALQVIDEALASDNLKDKIWAVDLILKRTPASEAADKKESSAQSKALDAKTLDTLSETELMSRIRILLDEDKTLP